MVCGMDNQLPVYIGTYTRPGGSRGIYRCVLDRAAGTLTNPELAAECVNPSFLAVHPGGFLMAVSETAGADGKRSGAVLSLSIDRGTGRLTPINRASSGGAGPCHLTVDRSGANVLVANYVGGSAAVLPVAVGGALAEPACCVQHAGSGVNPARQEGPHAHSVNLDAAGRFAFVADLGLDKVMVYAFDAARGQLSPHTPPSAGVPPGSGPRHFAFHTSGRFAYLLNEMFCTVSVFAYDAERAALAPLQTVSALPPGTALDPAWSAAEVQVHPNGRFLYASLRGPDLIAVFAIAPDGSLSPVEHVPTRGAVPRHFSLDPVGSTLVAANQDSNTLAVFRVDPATGRLAATGPLVEVPSPVCVRFLGARAAGRATRGRTA
jgi:6-phosphogluconolactonase